MPLECGIWSKLLTDYKTLEESIKTIINQYSALGCDGSTVGGIVTLQQYQQMRQKLRTYKNLML